MILRAAFLLSLLIGNVAYAASPLRCESLFTGFENPNTNLKASNYAFEHTRSIGQYHFFLRESFKDAYETLGPQDTLVDLGAGIGLAGMQTVQDKGARVVVINAQNFPQLWRNSAQRVKALQTRAVKIKAEKHNSAQYPFFYTIESIGGLSRSAVVSVGHAFWLDIPGPIEKPRSLRAISPEEVVRVTLEATDEYEKVLRDPRFKYRVGYAEDVLPQYNLVSMITDVFGAFFYSSHRAPLLDQMRAALKPGASAYLSVVGFNERNINDIVQMKDGSRITLFDYLLKFHADEFRIEGAPLGASRDEFTTSPTVLIFTPKSKAPLRLAPTRALEPFRNGSMEVPQLEYREI